MKKIKYVLTIFTLSFSLYAQGADYSDCDAKLRTELSSLMENDRGGILALQFDISMLKLAKKNVLAHKTTIENYLKKDTEDLVHINTKDPNTLKNLEVLYSNYSSNGLQSVYQHMDELGSKSQTATFNKASNRLVNKDISSYMLFDKLKNPDSDFDKMDVAITWYMQQVAEQAKKAEGNKSFTATQNMLQLSNRLARYTGVAGDTDQASLSEIENDLSKFQTTFQKFLDESLINLKSKMPECFSEDQKFMGLCQWNAGLLTSNLSNLLLDANNINEQNNKTIVKSVLSLTREGIEPAPQVSIAKVNQVNPEVVKNPEVKCSAEKKMEMAKNPQWKTYAESMNTCLPQQKTLWANYGWQLKMQIAKLVKGISYEKSVGTNPAIILKYKNLLRDLVAKSAYITDMYKQISKVDSKNMCAPFALVENPVDASAFGEALDKATEAAELAKEEGTISSIVKDKFKEELIKETFTHLGKAAIGQTKQILTSASLTSVLNVTASGVTKGIIKGAVKGAIVSLILEPLYGQTTPKYYDWSQAVEKNSELLLNPQWMNEAGVGVAAPYLQWETHCRALKEYKTNMTGLISKLNKKPANDFKTHMNYIIKSAAEKKRDDEKAGFYIEAADATYVKKQQVNEDIQLPYWAKD